MIADLMDFDTKIAEDAVKRCAVVGGGGYVGWQLSQRLRNDGFQVWILDIGLLPEPLQFLDSDANHHADLAPIQFCEVDIREGKALTRCFLDILPEVVFHVASFGMSGREMLNKKLIEEVNIEGVKNLLDACCRSGVTRLIYTSTYNTVYGGQEILNGNEETTNFLPLHKFIRRKLFRGRDRLSRPSREENELMVTAARVDMLTVKKKYEMEHPDHYALTKSVGEQLVLTANRKLSDGGQSFLRTCCLRLPGIYGPGETRHIPRIVHYLEKGWVGFRYGDALVDFIHVENVVQVHILACQALGPNKNFIGSGKSYFVNDGLPVRNFEFFRPLIEGLGYPYPAKRLPLKLVFVFAMISEFLFSLEFVKRFELDQYFPLLTRTEVYKTGVTHYFSIAKARDELGYVPRLVPNDLSEVIRTYLDKGHRKRMERPNSCWSGKRLFVIAILLFVSMVFMHFV